MDVNVSLENQLKKRKYIFCTGGTWSHETLQNIICEDEFLQLNYQLLDNERGTKFKFVKRQSFDVEKNILLYRMYDTIDNKIDKNWLQLGLNSNKIKCKDLFLQWLYWKPNDKW